MNGDYSWKKSAGEYAGLYSLITGIKLPEPAPEKAVVTPVKVAAKKSEVTKPEPKKAATKKVTASKADTKKTSAKTSAVKKPATGKAVTKKNDDKEKKG